MPAALPRSVGTLLNDTCIAPLLQQLATQQSVANLIAAQMARLAPEFNVLQPGRIELQDGILRLIADSAAQAAKLRQGVPGLIRLMHTHGVQVSEIRIRVQPERLNYPEQATTPAQAGGASGADQPAIARTDAGTGIGASLVPPLAFAEALAQALPDSPLRQAAERLSRTLKGALTKRS